ncbi:APC family permease [Lentilactobacillus hilgardii]|uniref:Amino acid permease n=1 Tax=Lentilactobacillus hilgardii (strain ATCC 8290 / DSM 20176 / CCUG 30140 / JCM 1155 / KCTC 3500 / NBRC 15886 / NCIMB 8040 / NRRL B-1843 / 9) TaxID=1423757 RepID=C0XH81_LENH9|nr:amino acid permease [Lentilactobacillus hilgardii]EEI19290.1 amino acid permease [Lentilactobacillus buchneri ATCC 11577]EEI25243.1 amino acid permease [Lentilactobacillus hilgardii DSM 20176 = ATCC 8290]KRK59467.1 APC family amino acid-polyamine-organocation transporter [Lentilactobacillus hilgardii DSM 20176 = ATCC 8290]MCP9332035.1 amino acid permease [Lentilactobacillus hilgardii]MCP9348491.1 amino acid permease [Lentilactobacillus hilgardii]
MKQQKEVSLDRDLGLWSALSLVIGTIIGAGVFVRQSAVLDDAGSTTMGLLAWLAGGILTITAGLTIAEIASQMPETGGLYVYMEKIYGRIWGFLSGWMQIVIYGPAMIASLGAYLAILLSDFFGFPSKYNALIAIGAIILVGILNLFSNRYGATFAIITTLCKLVPVAALIIFGLFFGKQGALGQSISEVHQSAGNFGVAILATLFAFDGWILIANLGGEIKNPRKLLPQAITFGILAVLVIYMLVSYGVYRAIPAEKIHSMGTGAIPFIATTAFGNVGGKILSIGIIISIVGCMNGKVMTFPRIMYAMAKRHQLPFSKTLSYLHPKSHTPIFSTIAELIIVTIMIVFSNADRLSELCIFTVYCFYVMAFVGVFLLRKRNPNQHRVFSTPLFPLTPIVAIGGSLFVIVSEIMSDLPGVLTSFIFVAVGVPVFYYETKKHGIVEPKNEDAPIDEDDNNANENRVKSNS